MMHLKELFIFYPITGNRLQGYRAKIPTINAYV